MLQTKVLDFNVLNLFIVNDENTRTAPFGAFAIPFEHIIYIYVNSSQTNFQFQYTLKASEKQTFLVVNFSAFIDQ